MYPAISPLLHVPDGFLSPAVTAITWLLAAIAVWLAAHRAQTRFRERLIPLAGIMAAFIFAAQMINFPIAGGTSGHLVGAALAAIVLGPWMGILVMTAVIALQALLFQDGGLVAMGANILIMGVVPALGGYGLYRAVINHSRRLQLATAGVAAWFSVMAAALLTALLLGFSGTFSLRIAVPAMLGVHALIGLGEALITVAALSFIMNSRPQLLQESAATGSRGWIIAGGAIVLLVIFLSPFASGLPDGLEWVAQENGFLQAAREAPYQIMPDYTIPALGDTAVSTIVAGAVGAAIAGGGAWVVARLLPRLRSRKERAGS
ncbi:MAG: energy-coupling factor ABC transporter permease [Candidatus Promineifilaceae bacterium]|nr:energy-coupling factor ABC transporter permease [Candidatus Promineifilaceae bacterium]